MLDLLNRIDEVLLDHTIAPTMRVIGSDDRVVRLIVTLSDVMKTARIIPSLEPQTGSRISPQRRVA